jgi:hypothetical protein
MNIHFTWGATYPLDDGSGAMRVTLLEGAGETRVSCLHLPPGTITRQCLVTQPFGLLVVHGKVTLFKRFGVKIGDGLPFDLLAGVGEVLEMGQHYRVRTEGGAIVLMVECDHLKATREGISDPERIRGQLWPGPHVGAKESY